jgi:hypothetical protein
MTMMALVAGQSTTSPAGNERQQLSTRRFGRGWRHVEAAATAARPVDVGQMRWRAVQPETRFDSLECWANELFFDVQHKKMTQEKIPLLKLSP